MYTFTRKQLEFTGHTTRKDILERSTLSGYFKSVMVKGIYRQLPTKFVLLDSRTEKKGMLEIKKKSEIEKIKM